VIFYYLDASAWVKRYYQEPGTRWVADLFSQHPMVVCSSLGLIEVMATLVRKQRAGEISSSALAPKLQEVEEDWRRFLQVHLTVEAVGLAKEMVKDFALRGADAIHLASARMVSRRFEGEEDRLSFVTSDQALKAAARSSGLVVIDPSEEENSSSRPTEDEEEEVQDEE
jgi:predicted nucleic acid-binding protein